jgi:hypothetical protein
MGMHGPRQATSQGLHQTSPRGVGVYGEFYGIEGDGMEAGEIFAPVIFWGMCGGDVPTPQSLSCLFPSDVEQG